MAAVARGALAASSAGRSATASEVAAAMDEHKRKLQHGPPANAVNLAGPAVTAQVQERDRGAGQLG